MAGISWPYVHEVVVEWRDLDAAGHVNNAVYLSYMESARTSAYFALRGLKTPVRAADLDIILARASVDFRAAATLGDRLRVEVSPLRAGQTSFTLGYRVTNAATGVLVAEGESIVVAYDYEKERKKPLDERLRSALEAGISRPSA